MSWMRLDASFARHRKVRRLARALGCPAPTARGLVVGLWLAVLTEDPDGQLDGWTAEDLLDATGGEELGLGPSDLAAALVEAGWLEQTDHGYAVHDWGEYSTGYHEARRRAERRARKRAQSSHAADSSDHAADSPDHAADSPDHAADSPDHAADSPEPLALEMPGGRSHSPVNQVIDHYRRLGHPHTRGASKTARRMIQARLRHYTVADLCRALDALHRDEWHVQNGHATLEAGLRTDERVSKWLDLADRGAAPPKAVAVAQSWANKGEE